MPSKPWIVVPLTTTLAACQSPMGPEEASGSTTAGAPSEVDDREVTMAEVPPPPISGGTLLVIDDGTRSLAVAADPDRDLVHVVDLDRGVELHAIALPSGDEPGRLVADAEGRVHVVARRAGVLVDLDPHTGELLGRRELCPNPRGVAYDPDLDLLHVACSHGDLLSLPAAGGEITRRVYVAPDLRDVVLTRDGLAVSQLRSARMRYVDDDGVVTETVVPPNLHGPMFGDALEPNTAWRTIATNDGDWLMVHQVSTQRAVGLGGGGGGDAGGFDTDEGGVSGSGGADGGYGDGSGGGCGGVVHPVITRGSDDFVTRGSALLQDTVLAVDVAISAADSRIAMAIAGQQGEDRDGVAWVRPDDLRDVLEPGCEPPIPLPVGPGQYIAVTFDAQGRIVAQSREPAKLVRIDPTDHHDVDTVELAGGSVRDTGHDLFHLDAGRGIACASCHAEGGDDGRTWAFAGLGERHTPALGVGLGGTEPFHWQGDLNDIEALMSEVHEGRMGGRPQSVPRIAALARWVFALPIPAPRRRADEPEVARGEQQFHQLGCDGCHRGETLDGGPESVDVGVGFAVQVPPLRGVSSHPPYMHDGRAENLYQAVRDMVDRTRPGQPRPTEEELTDLVAYLESL